MANFYIAGTYRPPLDAGYAHYIDWLVSDRDLEEPVASSPYDISDYEQLWYKQTLYGDLAEIKLRIVDYDYSVIWESGLQDINNLGYSIIKWNINEIPEGYRVNIPCFEIMLETKGEFAIRSDFSAFLANGIEKKQDYAFIM